ncbi:MAG TPA: DoxX family protein [Vicinamibacteria bacterium]|nr:DoxX family protein [Vicinamibacteria bacterium]
MLTTLGLFDTPDAPAVNRSSRVRASSLLALQVVVAATILTTGSAKLMGVPMMVETFEHIGLGQWFRYVTGGIEVLSALALLVQGTAALGALVVVGTMVGAVAAHLFVIGGSAVPAVVVLVAAAGIAWARRGDLGASLAGACSGRLA